MFGAFLRKQLTALRKTQADLARAVGKTPQAVASWVKGETRPKYHDIPALAVFLKVSETTLAEKLVDDARDVAAPSDQRLRRAGQEAPKRVVPAAG